MPRPAGSKNKPKPVMRRGELREQIGASFSAKDVARLTPSEKVRALVTLEPKAPASEGSGLVINMVLDGVAIKPLASSCPKCPHCRAAAGGAERTTAECAPVPALDVPRDSRAPSAAFRSPPAHLRLSNIPAPPPPPEDLRTPQEKGVAEQNERIRLHILKSEKELIALNESRRLRGEEALGTLPDTEPIPREYTGI